jgi:hypothetical protein
MFTMEAETEQAKDEVRPVAPAPAPKPSGVPTGASGKGAIL